MFNDELWRIIAKESDGTYKIIRDELLPDRAFDERNHRLTTNNTYCSSPTYGCSVYGRVSGMYTLGSKSGTVTEDSSLAEYLNGEYYNSLNQTAKGQVQIHMYNIGGIQLGQSGSDSITNNLRQEKAYQWTGNIGLPNVTDVLRASTNSSCTSVSAAREEFNVCTINYLLDDMPVDQYYSLTMNGAMSSWDKAPWYVWNIDNQGGLWIFDYLGASAISGVRPVIYLKSTIAIMSGDGTKSNPHH